jgi:AcrR family transcriptional regulator
VRRRPVAPRRLRRANSSEQKQYVREAIIAAGRGVFAEAAPGDASVRRIAAVAGYSPGIIYQYFKDKQTLFLAIRETDLTAFADALERTAAQVKDPAQRVRAVFLKALRYWNEHYDQFQVLLGMRSSWGVPRPADDHTFGQSPVVKRSYRACREPIRQLFKTYPTPPLPVRLATDTMIAAIAGVLFIPRQASVPWSDTVAMGRCVINTLLSDWQRLAKRSAPARDGSVAAARRAADAARQLRRASGDRKVDSPAQHQ